MEVSLSASWPVGQSVDSSLPPSLSHWRDLWHLEVSFMPWNIVIMAAKKEFLASYSLILLQRLSADLLPVRGWAKIERVSFYLGYSGVKVGRGEPQNWSYCILHQWDWASGWSEGETTCGATRTHMGGLTMWLVCVFDTTLLLYFTACWSPHSSEDNLGHSVAIQPPEMAHNPTFLPCCMCGNT